MANLSKLYGSGVTGNLMQERFRDPFGNPKAKVEQLLQARHMNGRGTVGEDHVYHSVNGRGDHSWKVPYGLLYYWAKPIRRNQMVILEPWYATWISPKTGKRLKKMFQSLPQAIHFVATRAQYVDPNASVISKQGYDIPPKLRGKLPKKTLRGTYYWCPFCVTARLFHRVRPEVQFNALKKVWVAPTPKKPGHYDFRDRRMRLLACKTCGCTNQNHVWRRSNQPWEKRKFKRGARRAKSRVGSSFASTVRGRRSRT